MHSTADFQNHTGTGSLSLKTNAGTLRAGLTGSQRGLHGGYVLMREPRELTIWEVVDADEPFKRIHECPLGIQSHGSALCLLHRRLDAAMATVEEQFRATTIADLLAQPGSVTPLCQEKKGAYDQDQPCSTKTFHDREQ